MTDKKVETEFFVHQWGPCLAQLKLDDGVVKHLLSVAKSSNKLDDEVWAEVRSALKK